MKELYLYILLIVIALLSGLLIRKYFRDYLDKRTIRKRLKRGKNLEKCAHNYLKSKGFKVVASQKEFIHTYMVDGVVNRSKLIVDYLVEKRGKRFIVEVKSGSRAISLKEKLTRRQLLEYDYAIKNDGIFLLDMESRSLKKVNFISKVHRIKYHHFQIIIVVGVLGIFMPLLSVKIAMSLILMVYLIFLKRILGSGSKS